MATVVEKKETLPVGSSGDGVPEAGGSSARSGNGAASNDSYHSASSPEGHAIAGTNTAKDCASSLARLMSRTGCSIVQQNGQRRYGPPEGWNAPVPRRGCEVFVGKIPRDSFEDELVPVFENAGSIYEIRLMMDYNGQNRGYAFVVFSKPSEAKECVKILNNYEIRKVRDIYIYYIYYYVFFFLVM